MFSYSFPRPGGTVKLCLSVPVELYTVFSDLKNLAKNPGQTYGEHLINILTISSQSLAHIW